MSKININRRDLQYIRRRLTVSDIAKELKVSKSTIYRWNKKGSKTNSHNKSQIDRLRKIVDKSGTCKSRIEKENNAINLFSGVYRNSIDYQHTKTTDNIYSFNSVAPDPIMEKMEELIVDSHEEGIMDTYFSIQLGGITESFEKEFRSTKLMMITDPEGNYLMPNYDKLFQDFQNLQLVAYNKIVTITDVLLIQKEFYL